MISPRFSVGLCVLFAACAHEPEPSAISNHTSEIVNQSVRPPNVLLIVTDDQGYGDLGAHGNPVVRTPRIDRLAAEGAELTRFYVSPVCSPTRASLLTGRYNYRTRVVDTYRGRSMMDPEEITLAEMLGAAGYRTGIFGKWHLGDNAPMRPIDQGFDEALVHRGGGIGQPADPPDNHYMDPVLQHNGRPVRARGYCSDVFTDAATAFIERERGRPFFVYLAFNCPHAPLEVPDAWVASYRGVDFAGPPFPSVGHAPAGPIPQEGAARIYAMVTNIDENLGRLFARLEALGLARDTIVVFLSDNGPEQPRYNAGLRGLKGGVYEGGIRAPCFVRWPARIPAGRKVAAPAAHIDMVPTLLEACGAARPRDAPLDGVSLLPLLSGAAANLPERTLYFQWHRGDAPEPYRVCAARGPRWKLVQADGAPEGWKPPAGGPVLRLFDLDADPYELRDVAGEHPDLVAPMRAGYEAWFRDVGATRGYDPPRIALGDPKENPATLTRQDWRGPRADWGTPGARGGWEVDVARAGEYDFTLRFDAAAAPRTAHLALGGVAIDSRVDAGAAECAFHDIALPPGPGRLEAWVGEGASAAGVRYVDVRRRE